MSSRYNPLTGTNLTGCVSDEAKRLLKARDTAATELDFYDRVKARFWEHIGSVAMREKVPRLIQVRPHEFHLPYWS